MELHQKQKNRDDLQKEVLSALFNTRERSEESPRRTVKDVNKNSRYRLVFEPPTDSMEEYKIDMNFSKRENVDGTFLNLILNLCYPCFSGKLDSQLFGWQNFFG